MTALVWRREGNPLYGAGKIITI